MTIISVIVLSETEKGETDRHKQFADKVLKARYIGFERSG
jgi:hypothetical protein